MRRTSSCRECTPLFPRLYSVRIYYSEFPYNNYLFDNFLTKLKSIKYFCLNFLNREKTLEEELKSYEEYKEKYFEEENKKKKQKKLFCFMVSEKIQYKGN